jgi:hypothetical protein
MEGFLKNAPSTEETIKGEKFKFEAEGQIHTIENVNKTTEAMGSVKYMYSNKTIPITGMARPNADSAPHLILAVIGLMPRLKNCPSAAEHGGAPFHLLMMDMHIAFGCLHVMVPRDYGPARTVGSQPFFVKRGPEEFAMKAWSTRLRHVGDGRAGHRGRAETASRYVSAQSLDVFKETFHNYTAHDDISQPKPG